MPCTIEVKSLGSLCVNNVVNYLSEGKWDDSSYCEEDEGAGVPGYWSSPFEVLPSLVLSAVFKAARRTAAGSYIFTSEGMLRLLITKKLEELDLLDIPYRKYIFSLLCWAALIRSPLKTLKLTMGIPYHKLQTIIPSFPHLRVLDMYRSETVNDSFLSLVVSSCPELKSLDVTCCVNVTDDGMERLCRPTSSSRDSPPAGVNGSGGVCGGSLLQLGIRGTGVTRHGARLVLEKLPELQELRSSSTIQVIADMYRSGYGRPLGLTRVECYSDGEHMKPIAPVEGNSLAAAIQLCPLLVRVDLGENYSPSRQDLRALLELDILERLNLPYGTGPALSGRAGMSFDEDLLPILKKFGHKSLDFLRIVNIDEVNLGAFLEHCSHLRVLCIDNVRRYRTQSRGPVKPSLRPALPNLQRLLLPAPSDCDHPNQECNVPSPAHLALLLSSAPALVYLELGKMHSLTDGIFKQAIDQHGFLQLTDLELTLVPNGLTEGVLDLFFHLENPLSTIVVNVSGPPSRPFKRYKEKDAAWEEKIEKRNLDLSIYFTDERDLNQSDSD